MKFNHFVFLFGHFFKEVSEHFFFLFECVLNTKPFKSNYKFVFVEFAGLKAAIGVKPYLKVTIGLYMATAMDV